MSNDSSPIRQALAQLNVQNLVFGIQEPSLPGQDAEDLGRGALASEGTRELMRFVAELGFNGLQLGPMGITARGNPSPYDSSLFSRSPLGLSLPALVETGELTEATLNALLAARPAGFHDRVPYDFVHDALDRALGEAFLRAEQHTADRRETDRYLEENRSWLVRDALWDPLAAKYGSHEPAEWSGSEGALDAELWNPHPAFFAEAQARRAQLEAEHATALRRFAFAQRLVAEQHVRARARAGGMGLKLYGDLQIGVSNRDAWAYASLFLRDYRMGAPPSRTNPDGQPWNYRVLDPEQMGTREAPGPALQFVRTRMRRMLTEFDSVRIDHPHGWVCPWVYRAGSPDPIQSVQNGARLFESPDLPDHPGLSRFARVSAAQIDPTQPRHADRWVRELEPAQVAEYAVLIDTIVEAAAENVREVSDLICEVLSTLPTPLEAVMKRHGLGRFRVLQKASLTDPSDVYRSGNARPEDWVMIGNHDTPSIWALIEKWKREGKLGERANYLASRLLPEGERALFVSELLAHPGRIAHAMLADALASPAENTMVFFTDLFGISEPYNVPGTVNASNWTLRLTPAALAEYTSLAREDRAIDLQRAVGWALRARDPASPLLRHLLTA